MAHEFESEQKKILLPKDGSVVVTLKPQVTEKEIYAAREEMTQRLDGAYRHLCEHMQEFQKDWDQNPRWAMAKAIGKGAWDGGKGWGESIGELFEKETWTEIGKKIAKATGEAYDHAKEVIPQQLEDLKETANEVRHKLHETTEYIANSEDTLQNWAWWQTKFDETVTDAKKQATQKYEDVQKAIDDIVATGIATAETAQKLYKHRNAILELPSKIASGGTEGVNATQSFIDVVVKDIDHKTYEQIKSNPNYYIVLALIEDHETVLGYLAYTSLIIEAVPPNFYAYLGTRGSVYLALEIILSIILAFLTAGIGVAVRIGTLAARLLASGAKAGKALKYAERAIEALSRVVDDIGRATEELHRIGEKLARSRPRGKITSGSSKETLKMRKESTRRQHHCSICKSPDHTTPHDRLGVLVYE